MNITHSATFLSFLFSLVGCSGLYGVQVGPKDLDTSSSAAPKCTPLIYPPSAQMIGVRGDVVVRVQVTADGKIHSAELETSSSSNDLDSSSLLAARGWCHFAPAPLANGATTRTVKMTFVWDLIARSGVTDLPVVKVGIQPSLQ
jgi:TonB family protein